MEYRNEERYASQRGRMLSKQTELRRVEGEALAYIERGYSYNGAAKQMDTSKGTVKSYVEKAIALYGFEVAEQKVLDDDDELPQYEQVDSDYFMSRSGPDRRKWLGLVMDHEGSLPAEFVEDVRDAAMERGLYRDGF